MKKQIKLFSGLSFLLSLFLISCSTANFNSEQGFTEKEALKILKEEAKRNGFTLIEEKFVFTSNGNKSIAHILINEVKGNNFQEGINISLLLIDNFVLMDNNYDNHVKSGVYTVNIKSSQFKRKNSRYPVNLTLIGKEKNYSFDNLEMEVVSLGGVDELPKDYRISGGFCGLTIKKNYKISINVRRYLAACDCCVSLCPDCSFLSCSWEEINNFGCCISEFAPEGCD